MMDALRRFVAGPEASVCPNETCRHREASIVCSLCKTDKKPEPRPCYFYRDVECVCAGRCLRVPAA